MIAIVGYDMRLSIHLMVLSSVVAFASVANAGGLDDVAVEQPVIVAPVMGSLGGGAALVGGILLIALLAAASSGGSGSH